MTKYRCLCGGRGWAILRDHGWWEFCPACLGDGFLSVAGAAKVLGVSSGTVKKMEAMAKVRLSTVLHALDNYNAMRDRLARKVPRLSQVRESAA